MMYFTQILLSEYKSNDIAFRNAAIYNKNTAIQLNVSLKGKTAWKMILLLIQPMESVLHVSFFNALL